MKLTIRLSDALAECARYTNRGIPYRWRVASMRKLTDMQMVEPFFPDLHSCAWRPTEAGLSALAEQEKANG